METELSRLAVLPARPPTPPKESTTFSSSQDSDPIQGPKISHPGLHTPTESSPSAAHSASKSSERRSKRVGFRLGSSKLNNASSSSPNHASSPRSNPSSKNTKPAKSILKPARKLEVTPTSEPGQTRDFPRMLDDFCQQLAGNDMSSRLEAYITLNSNLKTYKNGPEQRALVEKMPLLTSFVERDLQDADTTNTARGTQLATEVVKLVSTLLWSPTMADELPESFQLFVLNKAINVAGSEKAPKSLVSQFLHLLAIQKFRPRILSNERINRLLSFLKHIEERVKGKQIMAHRLDIYKRLISQAPNLMAIRFKDWFEHIFHALMSTTKEIRSRALSLGFEAGQTFGASEQVTKAVSSLFSHSIESDGVEQRYGDLFAARLGEWLAIKEEARHVPQIWSCVLMFLRHQPRPLERWTLILTWLQLMKKCFNSTDNETRLQANRAWTRLIFAVDPCLTTGDSMVALLREPIRSQLDRARGTDKDTVRMRASVVAVYSTLLYHAVRPGATHDTLDRYWKACVAPFFSTPEERVSTLEVHTAAEILCSLLGDRPGKSWTPKRAMEALPVKIEEIPKLDSKWVRQRAAWITPLIEAILLDESWWQSSTEQPSSMRVWKCFVASLAEAGRKEIKVSAEAKSAVAELVGALERFLMNSKSLASYERFAKLIEVASVALGPLPFTEPKFICVSSGRYQVADTTSSHSRKLASSGASATIILLRQLVRSARNHERAGLENSESKLVEISLRAASSHRTRLAALREAYSSSLPPENDQQSNASKFALWSIAMRFVNPSAHSKHGDALADPAQASSYEFHDATRLFEHVFELGIEKGKTWGLIEEAILSQLSAGNGQAASCPQTVEPLAKFFHGRVQKSLDQETISVLAKFLEQVRWPQQRVGVDATIRRMSGFSSPNPKNASVDPYSNLYKMIEEVMSLLYVKEEPIAHEAFDKLWSALSSLISSLPMPAVALSFHKIQPALAFWVTDKKGRLSTDTAESTESFKQVLGLWDAILEKAENLRSFDSSNFALLRELFLSGLSSRHRAVTNMTIKAWNATYGLQSQLPYTEELTDVLTFLGQSAEILSPGISNFPETDILQFTVEYLNTPASLDELTADGCEVESAWDPKDWTHAAVREPLAPLSQNEQTLSTPPKQKAPRRAQSTPLLRHDNSQIEFAEITSSPPNLETIESQLLTERQREVRDRQNAVAAAMFPDLRSSPKAKSTDRKHDLPRLQLRGEQDLEQSDIDEANSPTLPSPSGTPYLGSSPTPSQRRQSSRDRHSVAPETNLATQTTQRKPLQEQSDDMVLQSSTSFDSFGQTYGEELLALYEQPLGDMGLENVDIVVPSDFPSEPSPSHSDMLPVSRFDAEQQNFVQSVLAASSQKLAELELNNATSEQSSSPGQVEQRAVQAKPNSAENVFDVESSQVEAQIWDDISAAAGVSSFAQMEPESSSQADSTAAEQLSNKRKRSKGQGESRVRSSKRSRGRPRKQEQRSAEAMVHDEDMEDCIIVAVNEPISVCSTQSDQPILGSNNEAVASPTARTEKSKKSKKRKQMQESSTESVSDVLETSSPKKLRETSDDVQEPSRAQTPTDCITPAEIADSSEVQEGPAVVKEVAATQTTPSRHRIRAITGEDFLLKIRELLADAKEVVLGGTSDDIMAGLMDIGREIMTAKRRG